NHAHMLAFEFEFKCHLKQSCRPRVTRMKPMTEAGRQLPITQAVAHNLVGRRLYRIPRAHERQACIEKAHARLDIATVMGTEGQDARRYAVLERSARRRHIPRRERGWRRH